MYANHVNIDTNILIAYPAINNMQTPVCSYGMYLYTVRATPYPVHDCHISSARKIVSCGPMTMFIDSASRMPQGL